MGMQAIAVASIIAKMRKIRSRSCPAVETIDELILTSSGGRLKPLICVRPNLSRNLCLLLRSDFVQVKSLLKVPRKKIVTIANLMPMSASRSESERLVSADRAEDDKSFELKLRPKWLGEFIGQEKAKEQLGIALTAAKSRGEALDHVLLFGPPGLGKTTLATIIANEMDVGFQQTSGPALQIQGDLTAILTNLRDRQVLFLDEIHRLQPVLEEKLYTALEDYKLDIIIGQGPAARTHVMEIKPFTFIAATTRPGLLSSPLRSRFGILLRLEFYTEDELRYIVERSAEVLNVPIDRDGAAEIALRSRGTPRIANRLCGGCVTMPRCGAREH